MRPLPPHIKELVDVAIGLHTASGGTAPEKLREPIEATCDLANLDGQIEGLNRVQAGFELQALLKRVTQ